MKNKIAAVATFLGVLGFGSQLSALDTATTGLQCRYYNKIGNDTFFDPGGLSANGLKNTSATNYYVSCPITKTMAVAPTYAAIYIDDNATDCKLYTRDAFGASSNIAPTWTGNVGGSTYLYEWFVAGGWNPGAWGSVAIYCRIDAGKAIQYYRYAD